MDCVKMTMGTLLWRWVCVWACLWASVVGLRMKREAEAEPTPVANPNLAALTGLGAISGSGNGGGLPPGLLANLPPRLLSSGASPGGGAGSAGGVCGNQDFLTNLLVYQYLSGSIPGGASGSQPQLAGLLGSQGPATTTVTTVSTSQTTLVVDVPASTIFSTSTTSYVTTITSIDTTIIPVIFRGSKITTTITESSQEVITATEYFTESSVHQPTIVQTLPVHITITETRTRGLDGHYTIFDFTPGLTSVVHEPLSTATLDLETTGLDLSNLDLSQLDLTSLAGALPSTEGDPDQVLSMLSSLLQSYDDEPVDPYSTFSTSTSSSGGNNGRDFRNQAPRGRFTPNGGQTFRDSPDYPDYGDAVEETPKYNVLRGFTLSDQRPSQDSGGSDSGRASTATRYSKYHRKNKVENNGISTTEATSAGARESERFSASTRRRTLSRAVDRRRSTKSAGESESPPSSRFVPAVESQYYEETSSNFRPFGQRRDREVSSSTRRRGSLDERSPLTTQRSRNMPRNRQEERSRFSPRLSTQGRSSQAPLPSPQPTPAKGLSTVLTMYISGSEPGQFFTRVQTIQLRSLGSSRRRRSPQEEPVSETITSSNTPSYETSPTTVDTSTSTALPQVPLQADPHNIVKLLKQLEPIQVKNMLHSLQKWVNFYSHEVLDETKNQVTPELTSSLSLDVPEVENEATLVLPNLPSSITPLPLPATDMCPAPPTVTSTVYRTVVVTSGLDITSSVV